MENPRKSSAGSKQPKIGLIGVGTMGRMILSRLIETGHDVIVFEIAEEANFYAKSQGAEIVHTPQEIPSEVTLILLCLPGPMETEAVMLGDDGLITHLGSDHIIIDLSTSDPAMTRYLAEEVEGAGGSLLDAPILGRPASIGHWILPVGGDKASLEHCLPTLETFASQAIWVGPSGAGHTLKLLNQLMFSTINGITAEVLAICTKSGLSPNILFETIASSGAATVSGLFRETGRKIVDRDFEPVFTIDLLCKDASLGLKMAKDFGAPPMIAEVVQTYNEIAKATGLGNEDTSALVKVFESLYEPALNS